MDYSIIHNLINAQEGLSVRKLAQEIEMSPSGLRAALKNETLTVTALEAIAYYFKKPVAYFFQEDIRLNDNLSPMSLGEGQTHGKKSKLYSKEKGGDHVNELEELVELLREKLETRTKKLIACQDRCMDLLEKVGNQNSD